MPLRRQEKLQKRAKLREIQGLMLDAVRQPLTSGDRTQRTWDDKTSASDVAESFIKPNDRLTSFERLQIYNQQYWWRLLGAFAEDFRGLRAVLGQRKFDRLAVAYLQTYPSSSWTLRNLGSKLVEFLEANPRLVAPYAALAVDMAKVEWANVVAFDGSEHKPVDPQKLAGSDPEKLVLRLQPYITLLQLKHPLDAALRRFKQREESSVASNAMSGGQGRRSLRLHVVKSRRPVYLAVHRVDYSVYYKRLDEWAFTLLCTLQEGKTLASACEEAFANSKQSSQASADLIRESFATWTRFGWFY